MHVRFSLSLRVTTTQPRRYAAAMHDMHVARDELERRLDDAALENDELRRAMTRQMADLDEVRGAQLVPISCPSRATSLYYI